MSAFIAHSGAVYWTTPGGSFELSEESVEDLLTVFQREGCAAAFNELTDASNAARNPPQRSAA